MCDPYSQVTSINPEILGVLINTMELRAADARQPCRWAGEALAEAFRVLRVSGRRFKSRGEARRRIAEGRFFGFIAFTSTVARKTRDAA